MMTEPLPSWISDPSSHDPRYPRTKLEKEVRAHNMECLFVRILDGMCEGNSASAIIKLDHNGFKVGEVMKWILTDVERKRRYDEAEAIRTVVRNDVVRELIDDETADPVHKRDVLDFHKWEAPRMNREKFGDKTVVDFNVTKVNIRALLDRRSEALSQIVQQVPPSLPSPPTRQGVTYDAE